MMKSNVRDSLHDKAVSTQEISRNSGMLGSSGKESIRRNGVWGKESGMFLCDKAQLLQWPGCIYADARQFLESQTGNTC